MLGAVDGTDAYEPLGKQLHANATPGHTYVVAVPMAECSGSLNLWSPGHAV